MPSAINFDRFDFGLDLRKGASTSDANRLRVLKNAYVTEGRTIRKRPGLVKVATLEPGTVGLFSGAGYLAGQPGQPTGVRLHTFYGGNTTTITHANPLFYANMVMKFPTPALPITKIHYADSFNGIMYVAAEFTDGQIQHHYLDSSALSVVPDTNCPNTAQVAKIASKIWAVGKDGDTVRFSATNSPKNWTAANDAGFLPVGVQQHGSIKATALGFYSNRLVVFFSDSSQVWQVDVDPAKHAFLQGVDIGTIHSYSHANMAGDVFFLSPAGVRTITRQDVTTNLIDADVGSPIDRELVIGNFISLDNPRAQYYHGGGQYWLYSGNKAMVYTFSRTSGVSAWSLYEFPFPLEYIDELNAELYVRSGDNVYKLDHTAKTDDGVIYPVDIELSYLDFKSSGILKQIHGMDAVVNGTCEISYRFDPRNPTLKTDPSVIVSGDTRSSYVYPVELLATSIAPVIRNNDANDFELHSLTFYFDTLGNI